MTSGRPRALLLAPVFVYLSYAGLVAVHPIDWVLVAAGALTALPILPVLLRWSASPSYASAPVLVGLVGLASALSASPPTGVLASLDVGVLLLAPIWFLARAIESGREPGTAIFATVAGLSVGVLLLATIARTASLPSSDPTTFLTSLGSVLHDQGAAILAFVRGGVPSVIPLSQVSDPIFSLLSLLALVGLVAPWLGAPAIDELEERPLGEGANGGPREAARRRPLELPPEMDQRLDHGSVSSPSPGLSPSGALPLVAAALAALGFVALAGSAPSFALVVVGVGAVAGTVVVAITIWRGRGGTRGTPARRTLVPSRTIAGRR
jgi:hypothetical protein